MTTIINRERPQTENIVLDNMGDSAADSYPTLTSRNMITYYMFYTHLAAI